MASRRTDMRVEGTHGDQYVGAYGFPDGVNTQSGAASPDTYSQSTPNHRNTSHMSGGINAATSSSAHVLGGTSSPERATPPSRCVLRETPPPGQMLGATRPPGQVIGATPTPRHMLGATPPPDQELGATPPSCSTTIAVQHPASQDKDHDIPGRHQILESQEPISETAAALKKLQEAPSISSLPPTQTPASESSKKYNIAVPSVGCESLSTAQAWLQLSLNSGSLTGAAPKLQDAQVSNTNPATGISIIEDKQVESKMPNISFHQNSIESEQIVTSYVGMALSDNGERLADFMSDLPTEKQNTSSWFANNLDQSSHVRQWETESSNLPHNISQQSISLNEDLSLTARKTLTKSTQTDPTVGQDQEGCGGAASAELGVQTMAYGSSSSLPPDDILVRKLKRPIIQWLQRKLETRIGAAWQDLVDLHDWDYDRITDFENHCDSSSKSPFCMLLAESEFQMYRLCDLKKDLLKLPRKDILHDLDAIMNKHYK
ncbi:uncharacterized protein LOC124279399 [Haliotis rubra]|uniref:uncharacterized protein LOC124279399 n=1 Tax=Haliotis rubra TaxID=36100 RepID=UPI001EE5F43E|nr:uncharacterized protein LOC124279399 [Haliotis rubra]